ncbi:putative dihydroxy-acid dehydratase [Aureobasidium sp. EXF-10728]|nr:putative dihydroxy-acid dehydratase [Aureobasidium sp. EXF-10728]
MVEHFSGASSNGDYDLSHPINTTQGLRQGLTSYGDAHFSLFLRKVFIKAAGYSDDALSRPVIGIINTHSGFNPCHSEVPRLIEAVKRGVLLSGGLPIEFPTISLHESFASPTSMFLRNLMSMDTEEMIRAQPVDACVMIGGCDKTVPAQLMGGISSNKPVLPLVVGPMMPGSSRGKRIGACTDCRNNWAAYRAGTIDIEEISAINEELAPTGGTCGVMGTASTMACIVAALGLMPLRGASAPAVSSARLRVAEETGRNAAIAASNKEQCRPQTILSTESFLNAITVLQAIGGSTNAVVHLMAIINRHPAVAGKITLDTFNEIGRKTPLLVDLKPSGDNYMNDFHNAGGMVALLNHLRPLLFLNVKTITGMTLEDELDTFKSFPYSLEIIRSLDDPIYPRSAILVLRGNLAPDGAIIKASASKDRRLLSHLGPAVVFDDTADLARRIDDPGLDVTKDSVLVLKGVGPVGNPGMPEAGVIPIPRKLGIQGIQDMLRISDGRMSGTAGGTIVLHVSPESSVTKSVFGIVENGDLIELDINKGSIQLKLSDKEISQRIAKRVADPAQQAIKQAQKVERGYRGLYKRSVNQANLGCDFDFLAAELHTKSPVTHLGL